MSLWARLGRYVSKPRLFRWLGLYPPFLGAGVRVRAVAEDLRSITVEMKLRWWNQNYVGTHFGGSLYSVADPWFMLILMENLGPDYVVWDKAASIRFLKPGRGTVRGVFEISGERIAAIRAQADADGRCQPELSVTLVDEEGTAIAEVTKTLSVRRKGAAK
jgi:acyl-coenzyme A thioesterase PaaI-like protein